MQRDPLWDDSGVVATSWPKGTRGGSSYQNREERTYRTDLLEASANPTAGPRCPREGATESIPQWGGKKETHWTSSILTSRISPLGHRAGRGEGKAALGGRGTQVAGGTGKSCCLGNIFPACNGSVPSFVPQGPELSLSSV